MFQRLIPVFFCLLLALPAAAQEKRITISAPAALEESGLMKFMLPRFSLKTSIRIDLVRGDGTAVDPAAVDVVFTEAASVAVGGATADARAVFEAVEGPVYRYLVTRKRDADNRAAHAARFADWLTSETGIRTVESFRIDDVQAYRAASAEAVEVAVAMPTGDLVLGEKLSLAHCGRCHVINEKNRMNGLGSTPSFRALKALQDWDYRFQVFHILNPHPAFTQIEDITEPFDPRRPSPIAPLELTVDDVDAILAYVASLPVADLGQPVEAK